jgi:putative peptidoglycan lipid II flippase
VFQRGAFGREATEMTASVVYVLTFMLLIWCGNQLVMRLLLAQSQHRAILISTIMVVVLKIILNILMTPTLGLMGVALATVISVGLSTLYKYVAAAMYTHQGGDG